MASAYVADLSELTSPAANDFMLVSDTSDPLFKDKKMQLGKMVIKSGTPTASRLASWTDANTIQDAGFLVSDFARKTGSPIGGRAVVWTDANAIQDAGVLFTQLAQKVTAPAPVAGRVASWSDANTLTDSTIALTALAQKSGTPVALNIARWLNATTVEDGGFAVSDVARLSQNQTFAGRATFTAAGGTSGNGAFIGLGQAGYLTRAIMGATVTKRIYGTFVAVNTTNSVTLVGTIDILNGATQIITLGAGNTWTLDVSAADNTFGIIRTAGGSQLTFASWLSWI